MSRKDRNKEFLENISGSSAKSTIKYLDGLISECHERLEVTRGEEILLTQGELKGYRELKRTLMKKIA